MLGVERSEMSIISPIHDFKLRSSHVKSNFSMWIEYLVFMVSKHVFYSQKSTIFFIASEICFDDWLGKQFALFYVIHITRSLKFWNIVFEPLSK